MTAMDPKILAAVFASIAALTMSGTGSMEDIQNLEGQDFMTNLELPFDIDNLLGNIREGPDPENKVRIDVKFKSVETTLETSGKGLSVENYTTLSSKKRSFKSSNPVEFKDFSGSLTFSNETELKGRSSGFIYRDLNYTNKMSTGLSTDATQIEITGMERERIKLDNVDIDFESQTGTEISADNAPLKVNSFSGNISIHPDEERLVINGLVDRVEAGTTAFGG